MEENQVKQQKFPSFSLFLMVHGLYTEVYRGRVSHTRAVHGRVCWACVCSSFPFSPVHGPYTGVCVGRVSYTRACMLGVCPIHGPYTGVYDWACVFRFLLFSVHGPYTGVCVGRVSHTRSIHGRVCWACVLAFFP